MPRIQLDETPPVPLRQLDPDFDTDAYEKLFAEYLREDDLETEEDLHRRVTAYLNNLHDFEKTISKRYFVWKKGDHWSLTKPDWFAARNPDIAALIIKLPPLLPVMNYIDRASEKLKNDTEGLAYGEHDGKKRRYAIFRANNNW